MNLPESPGRIQSMPVRSSSSHYPNLSYISSACLAWAAVRCSKYTTRLVGLAGTIVDMKETSATTLRTGWHSSSQLQGGTGSAIAGDGVGAGGDSAPNGELEAPKRNVDEPEELEKEDVEPWRKKDTYRRGGGSAQVAQKKRKKLLSFS